MSAAEDETSKGVATSASRQPLTSLPPLSPFSTPAMAPSQLSTPDFSPKVLSQLQTFRHRHFLCDCKLVVSVGGGEMTPTSPLGIANPHGEAAECATVDFPAHRAVLAASSPFFENLFQLKEKESLTVVNLNNCTPQCLEVVLHYLYSGHLEMRNCEPKQLLTVARFCQISALEQLLLPLTRETTATTEPMPVAAPSNSSTKRKVAELFNPMTLSHKKEKQSSKRTSPNVFKKFCMKHAVPACSTCLTPNGQKNNDDEGSEASSVAYEVKQRNGAPPEQLLTPASSPSDQPMPSSSPNAFNTPNAPLTNRTGYYGPLLPIRSPNPAAGGGGVGFGFFGAPTLPASTTTATSNGGIFPRFPSPMFMNPAGMFNGGMPPPNFMEMLGAAAAAGGNPMTHNQGVNAILQAQGLLPPTPESKSFPSPEPPSPSSKVRASPNAASPVTPHVGPTSATDVKEGWCRNKKYIEKVANGYMCTVCKKVYGRYNSVSYHVTIYHRNPPIKCDEPGCQFTTREARYIHFHKYYRHGTTLPKSIDLGSRSCPFCRHIAKSPAMLEKHVSRHMPDCIKVGKGGGTGAKTFPLQPAWKCHTCGKELANQTDLTAHLLMHQDDGHSCDQCSYKGRTQQNLEQHKLFKHSSEMFTHKHTCVECGYSCASEDALDAHRRLQHLTPSNSGSSDLQLAPMVDNNSNHYNKEPSESGEALPADLNLAVVIGDDSSPEGEDGDGPDAPPPSCASSTNQGTASSGSTNQRTGSSSGLEAVWQETPLNLSSNSDVASVMSSPSDFNDQSTDLDDSHSKLASATTGYHSMVNYGTV